MSLLLFDKTKSFQDFGLDRRIYQIIAKLGIVYPTVVQSQCIPVALQGKDVLVRAHTGSGKTLAFCIPVVANILSALEDSQSVYKKEGVRALILAPTAELCNQISEQIKHLLHYCNDLITMLNVGPSLPSKVQVPLLKENPDIIIASPSRILEHLASGVIHFDEDIFKTLVVDEADLILSYGYEEDLRSLLNYLPKLHHTMLMSATLSPEVDSLKTLVLHNPIIIKMKENFNDTLTQSYIRCTPGDKFLIMFVLLKLGYIRGKTLFFVGSVNNCFRTKLMLEQFSIPSAVLNHELPINSRYSIIKQFNDGNFDYLIATDQSIECDEDEKSDGDNDEKNVDSDEESKSSKHIKTKGQDNVSRGIDFQDVETVVNINFPTTIKSYTHRIGRTARAGKYGNALSLIYPHEEEYLNAVLASEEAPSLKELEFDLSIADRFRYRVESGQRKVGKSAVREARLKEIKLELLNSAKLQSHFEDNPRERELLEHATVLRPKVVEPHLRNVPSYLVPAGMKIYQTHGYVEKMKKKKKRRLLNKKMGNNPLKTFSAVGKKRKSKGKDIKKKKKKGNKVKSSS